MRGSSGHMSGEKLGAPSSLKLGFALLLAAAVLCSVVARTNLAHVPFERDEGTYAYFGMLILQGDTPYLDFYETKPPALYYIYAAMVALFGDSVEALHFGFALLNGVTVLLVFLVARRLAGFYAAATAGASYAILSLSPGAAGFSIQSEHLIALFSSASLLAALSALDPGRARRRLLLLCGVLSCMAFLVKQSGAFVIAAIVLALVVIAFLERRRGWPLFSDALWYLSAVFGLYAATCAAMWAEGAFTEFWFWTVDFPQTYASQRTLAEGFAKFILRLGTVSQGHEPLWLLAALGLASVATRALPTASRVLVTCFVGFSVLAIVPGFRFYGHYWLQLLPALALLGALAVAKGMAGVRRPGFAWGALAVAWAAIGYSVLIEREYYFRPDTLTLMRRVHHGNPFIEAMEIGNFIRARSQGTETITVFGTEPEVYFYSGLRPASRHIYFAYTVSSVPEQPIWFDEYTRDIDSDPPDYFVFSNHSYSFTAEIDIKNLERLHAFCSELLIRNNYELIGIADVLGNNVTKYVWEQAARDYRARGRNVIYVYQLPKSGQGGG